MRMRKKDSVYSNFQIWVVNLTKFQLTIQYKRWLSVIHYYKSKAALEYAYSNVGLSIQSRLIFDIIMPNDKGDFSDHIPLSSHNHVWKWEYGVVWLTWKNILGDVADLIGGVL